MATDRIARVTRRLATVIALLVTTALALPAAVSPRPALAEEEKPPPPPPPAPAPGDAPTADPVKDLRLAERGDVPISERLAALARLLAAEGLTREQAEPAVRAATALLHDAPEAAAWLVLRAVEAGPWSDEARAGLLERVDRLAREGATHPPARALFAAVAFLAGSRPDGAAEELTATWPPAPFVEAVLRRDLAPDLAPGATHPADLSDRADARGRIVEQLPSLRALDAAAADDADSMRRGLDDLLSAKDASLPVLVHEARAGADGAGQGRLPRVTRAVLALGMIGDVRARTVLTRCLLESPSGWVRVAAATALGDLGDPGAAVALCRHLLYRGDVFRSRDAWEYPGAGETNVPAEAWNDVEYFATDCAAADALLRMGVRNAAGWLLRNKMDPSKASFRVRVLQDATDALRRWVPGIPVATYNPDAGIPQRKAALRQLLVWWESHRRDANLTKARFPEDAPNFRESARVLVDALRGTKLLDLQIAQETCALLGPAMTPSLLEGLAAATSKLHRGEIARALGVVDDARARPTLIELLRDPVPSVRNGAADSLGSYVEAEEVVDALVALLDHPEPGTRVSAMKSLSAAPRSAKAREAIASHPPEKHEAAAGTGEDREYRIAWTIARFVQEDGQPWAPIAAGLRDKERYVRRQWWDLLRRALRTSEELFDPMPQPGGPGWRDPDEDAIRRAR